jgi:hypothetical protein
MLGQFSLGTFGLIIGGILTTIGFIAYATDNPTLNLAGFFYGIPLVLGGLALKSSELEPVPFSRPTPPEILVLRDQQATVTQKKLRKDVTRYCYGQDAHLDEALKKMGLGRSDEDLPILKGLREESVDGAYALILEFESPFVPLTTWMEQREKMEKYFGPDLKLELIQPAEHEIVMSMITAPKTDDDKRVKEHFPTQG